MLADLQIEQECKSNGWECLFLFFLSIKLLTFPLRVKVTFVFVINEIKLNVHLEILNFHINVFTT